MVIGVGWEGGEIGEDPHCGSGYYWWAWGMERRETEAEWGEVALAGAQDMALPGIRDPLTPSCLGRAGGLGPGPLKIICELSGPRRQGFGPWGRSCVEVLGALTFPVALVAWETTALM